MERGANYRVVQTSTGGRYTELASGLSYLDENGQWQESQEVIELTVQGAAARHGPCKVSFSPNLNTAGAIDILTPDQKRLRNHVLGIYMTDTSSGSTLLIGSVKDSVGELLAPNQVIYRDAFDGLKADMRYTYGKGFFEAEAILRETPVLPDGFESASTVLQVLTEFIDPPTPNVSQNTIRSSDNVDVVDDVLIDFGGMMMVPGKAFSVNETSGTSDGQNNSMLYVRKQWQQINGRRMLIESLPWMELEMQLKPLPKSAANETKSTRQASIERELPIKQRTANVATPLRVASLPYKERGFAIDYVIVLTQSNWTFQTGQTYLVQDGVTISGSAVFQEGSIIKFATNGQLTLTGTVSCPASGSVFLTASEDISLGEDTSTSGLSGYYGNTHYIQLYNTAYPAVFRNLDVRWAREGVFAYTPNIANTVRDSRFANCQTAVGAYSGTLTLTNLIMCNNSIQYSNHGNAYIYAYAITNDCAGDSDSDGLGDSWEIQYFGNIAAYNAADDPDADGINNLQEYRAGTNPTTTTALPEPNFTFYGFIEPRYFQENLEENYDPNFADPYRITRTASIIDRVQGGTEEECDYYQAGSVCYYTDRTQHPPVMCVYTNDVLEGCQELSDEDPFLNVSAQYLNASGYGDSCSSALTSWSVSYSIEKWMTLTNYDGIKYVYQIRPRVYPYIPTTTTNCEGFGPEKTTYSTISVGDYPVSTDGAAYIALWDLAAYDITPRDSSLNGYRFDITACGKYQAPSDPFLNSINAIEPAYNYFSRIKTGPNGWGYDSYKLEYIITNQTGTQFTGTPFTNSIGDIGILSEVKFQVPTLPNFNTGWKWIQDVYSETAFYDPLKDTNQVFHVGRTGWTPSAPSANGNDGPLTSIADAIPDSGGYISTADAPSIVLSKGGYSTLHTGSIISLRLAARTWPTWNDAVISNLAKWHMTLIVRITSAQNASTTTAKAINSSIGTGATMTPMTLQEARQYYNQP